MVAIPALLALALLQAPQEPAPLGPTPPPDRYDDAYDARLFDAWGGATCAIGPRDPHPPSQPTSLRPRDWLVLEADADDAPAHARFLQEHVVLPAQKLPIEERGRPAAMPAQSRLEGAFSYAFARVDAPADEVRFVRAPGAGLVFVNGEGFIGDPDGRGWLGVPVELRKCANEVLAVGLRGGFELELWKPVTRIVMASWAVQVVGTDPWPDSWDHMFVPLFNASTQKAGGIHFHYDRACPMGTLPDLSEWHDGMNAVPLGLAQGLSYVFNAGEDVPEGPELVAPASAFVHGDAHAERRLLLLRSDAPRPRWPAPVPRRWPPPPSLVTLVIEASGDEGLDAESLAVARFCQQRLWERSGELVPLLKAEHYDPEWTDLREPSLGGKRSEETQVIRIGRLGGPAEGILRAGPEEDGSRRWYSIRASDASSMRSIYAVEPFFRASGPDGETWSLP